MVKLCKPTFTSIRMQGKRHPPLHMQRRQRLTSGTHSVALYAIGVSSLTHNTAVDISHLTA